MFNQRENEELDELGNEESEELGNEFGELIESNDLPLCGRCGCAITLENDSGWEIFVDKGTKTQKCCKMCWTKQS